MTNLFLKLTKNECTQVALFFLFSIAACGSASAQPVFQNATLTGSGNVINASWVPVVIANGSTIYVNLTIQFDTDPYGNLTVSAGFPQQSTPPAPSIVTFIPGNYAASNNSVQTITVTGPGVAPGGSTVWTLGLAPGSQGNAYPGSATWYTGALTNSPIAARLQKAGITSTFYTYGTSGNIDTSFDWPQNGIIGVSQVGNTLTFVSFSNINGDQNQPVDQITYTLLPN